MKQKLADFHVAVIKVACVAGIKRSEDGERENKRRNFAIGNLKAKLRSFWCSPRARALLNKRSFSIPEIGICVESVSFKVQTTAKNLEVETVHFKILKQ